MPASTDAFLSRRLFSTTREGDAVDEQDEVGPVVTTVGALDLELGDDVVHVLVVVAERVPVHVADLGALPVALDLLLDARPEHEQVVGSLVGLDQAGLRESPELLGRLVGVAPPKARRCAPCTRWG